MSGTAPVWQLGDALPMQTLAPVTRLQLIKYAGASGDYNPIHTIDAVAMAAGLPGVIAHGMLTMATVGRLCAPYLDRGFIQRFETRFTGMVFVEDTLTIGGRLSAREQTPAGQVYTFEVFAKNQREQPVATGSLVLMLWD